MLLYACASFFAGRTYLALNKNLIQSFMNSLQTETRESITREYLLGSLQKLSKRKDLQTVMIDDGLLEWLVDLLENSHSLSANSLESSVDLIKNLCSRSSGRKCCINNAAKTVKVLSKLLCHENEEVQFYVHDTLKSILTVPLICEEAKATGIEEVLQCLLKEEQPELNRQIEIIIKQINSTEIEDRHPESCSDDEEKQCNVTAMTNELSQIPLESKVKSNHQRKSNKQLSGILNPIPFAFVEDFIKSTGHVIKYQSLHLFRQRLPVPVDVFTDMFKGFVKMCRLLPIPGSVLKSTMHIRDVPVTSEVDVGIKPGDDLDRCCDAISIVVTIVEIKNLMSQKEFEEKEDKRTRPVRSSSESTDEVQVHAKPAIYHKVNQHILGQHGGELLLHMFRYSQDGKLFEGATKFFPGMIVIGTEVIFTLLEMKADHLGEMIFKSSSIKNKAYIHYSKPMDLLKKEDRDILLESFARLNNVKSK